ncbi:MAG: hypothetical protein ACPIOQ_24070, partial [Promethearchaeia archaeon]
EEEEAFALLLLLGAAAAAAAAVAAAALEVGAAAAGDHADGGTATRHRPRAPWTTRQKGFSVCPRTQVRPGAGSLCALWPVDYRCTGAVRSSDVAP